MTYILIGFIFGFFIPFLARRFAKFMPATFAYAIYRILKINKTVSKQKKQKNHTYQLLRNKYYMRSLGWGIFTSAALFLISQTIPSYRAPWIAIFVIVSFILTEIDKRMFLLPDILTIPLLIIGFTYTSFATGETNQDLVIATQSSALGALFGYFIPVLASIFLIKKHPDIFGGGDIKLLAAEGAWFGLENISFIILLSCALFAISCFIKKQRQDAFGPSIVLASLIILFLLEY